MKQTIISPNGTISFTLSLTEEGRIFYCALKNGQEVIGQSSLGVITDTEELTDGFIFDGATEEQIDESYTLPARKQALYVNKAAQLTANFHKGECIYKVIARAYDDAVAFRFALSGKHGGQIKEERTSFSLPTANAMWYMPYQYCYEGAFTSAVYPTQAQDVSIPVLLKTENEYLLISEAALDGGYSGAMLKGTKDGLCTCFIPLQTSAVQIAQEFISPWRFVVIGDLAAVFENTVTENLALPCDESKDYSFVQAGCAAWSWISGGYHKQRNLADLKRNIDLASAMKWRYFIMDDGWQPKVFLPFLKGKRGSEYGTFSWINELAAYAAEKNVGLIAWTRCNNLRTEEMRKRLGEWAQLGIKGIKVDFFDNENQDRMKLYDAIYEECAKCGLVVNAHGANKPTGEIRTYPNVLTREGIRGEEYGLLDAVQYTILPFTRGAVGPADVTETPYSHKGTVSEGFQAAVSFTIYSGLHCFAGAPEDYQKPSIRDLYFNFPAVWDESRLLEGVPAEHCVVMRRNGADYYVAGYTVKARTVKLNTSFLPFGEYAVTLFSSDSSRKLFSQVITSTAGQSFNVRLGDEDGFVMRYTAI